MEKKKIRVRGLFRGCTINSTGIAMVKFVSPYEEISNYIKLIALQDYPMKLMSKGVDDEKFKLIGMMRLKDIVLKGIDGAQFVFKGDGIELPNINSFLDHEVYFAVSIDVPEDDADTEDDMDEEEE